MGGGYTVIRRNLFAYDKSLGGDRERLNCAARIEISQRVPPDLIIILTRLPFETKKSDN